MYIIDSIVVRTRLFLNNIYLSIAQVLEIFQKKTYVCIRLKFIIFQLYYVLYRLRTYNIQYNIYRDIIHDRVIKESDERHYQPL